MRNNERAGRSIQHVNEGIQRPHMTVAYKESPLAAKFQHLPEGDFGALASRYEQIYLTYGQYPQIVDFPGVPLRRLEPKVYVCTNWSDAAGENGLLQIGDVDQNDLRALQMVVPKGTIIKPLQLLMTAKGGALSNKFRSWGVPPEYPHLESLFRDIPFVTPRGEKHDEQYEDHAFSALPAEIRRGHYADLLAQGAGVFLDGMVKQVDEEGVLRGDLAVIGKDTVLSAMAELFGIPLNDLHALYAYAKKIDHSLKVLPPPRELKEADMAVASSTDMISRIIEADGLNHDRMLYKEMSRMFEKGKNRQEVYNFLLMHMRVSEENPIDLFNLAVRDLSHMDEETRNRQIARMPDFVSDLLIKEPPVGFILRYYKEDVTLNAPGDRTFTIPKGSTVVFSPRLLASEELTYNSGNNITTFGGGDRECPGQKVGRLIAVRSLQQLYKRFSVIEYPDEVETDKSPFFRRILHAYGALQLLEAA